MAQLRQLEFTATGALMPNHDGGPEPLAGDFLFIPVSELESNLVDQAKDLYRPLPL